jgi:hypothetical protein
MVESVATGKGGRDTQTRMTNDAMGDGVVEDLSNEALKGATGGGKVAGTAGYGLVAPDAPAQPELRETLARRQADLRMKALSLHDQLMNLRLPTGSLAQSIEGMQGVENALQDGQYDNLRDMQAVVISDLAAQRRLMREGLRVERERGADNVRKIRHQMSRGLPDDFPEQYRTMIGNYYEALAKEGG